MPIGQIKSGSWHDQAELTRRTRAKRAIRRLAAPFTGQQGGPGVTYATVGGTTQWRMSPAAEILTDNPNPKYDPSPNVPNPTVKIRQLSVVRGVKGHGGTVKNFTGNATYRGMKLNKR